MSNTRESGKSTAEILACLRNGLKVTEQDLWKLVKSPKYDDRWYAIAWANLTDDMLDILAVDPEPEIRRIVASYTDDYNILLDLAQDPDPAVRYEANRVMFRRGMLED